MNAGYSAWRIPAGIAAVSFDIGGTLLEPVRPVAATYLDCAADLAGPLDPDHFGVAFRQAVEERTAAIRAWDRVEPTDDAREAAIWRGVTGAIAERLPPLRPVLEEWHARLVAHFDSPAAWRPVAGAERLVAEVAASGRRVALLSNWHSAVEAVVAGHPFLSVARPLLCSGRIGWRKPHPRAFAALADALGLPPAAVLHVGDSLAEDIDGAVTAGMAALHLAEDGILAPRAPVRRPIRPEAED